MVTTEPNQFASQYHDRMPVILRPQDYATWLDPETPRQVLLSLLIPFDDERMAAAVTEELRREKAKKESEPQESLLL